MRFSSFSLSSFHFRSLHFLSFPFPFLSLPFPFLSLSFPFPFLSFPFPFPFLSNSSGRDNKLHIHALPSSLPTLGHATSSSSSSRPPPTLLYSLDINALNYCRFSLLPFSPSSPSPSSSDPSTTGGDKEASLAIPNLTDSETVSRLAAFPSSSRRGKTEDD
jgi:hypothetical protein